MTLRAVLSRPLVCAGLLVAALVAPTPLSAGATSAADGTVTRAYVASTADIVNPERGTYHYTETHLGPDGRGHTPLDVPALRAWRGDEGVTLVYRIVHLDGYASVDVLAQEDLDRVAADLAAARQAGVKLLLRFAYSSSSSADAPADRAVAQIAQLGPVLRAGQDVVATLQAGFVGRWGEWYYSDSYASDPLRPWALTDADWAARGRVLDALLAATGDRTTVSVRYPAVKQRLVPPGDPRAGRVGVHDDCFLAGTDDYGTFATPEDRTWLAEQTRSVLMGGETCAVNAPRSHWPSASAELATYHWTYLNADFHRDVLASWGEHGWAEARRRLGHRLRLVTSSVDTTLLAGATGRLDLELANDGYAAPVSARPVELVLRSSTHTHRVPLAVDVRSLAPGTTRLSLPLTTPSVPGTYALSLALPDASPSLAGDPAYAVQLANEGVWDATSGLNDLGQTLTVAPAPVAPAPVALSTFTPTRAVNGLGPYERDRSNGGRAAGDGRALTLRGRAFATGLGVHSPSSLTWDCAGLPGRRLQAVVGIDDETRGRGSAVFQVWADGVLRWSSPVLTPASAPLPVSVPVDCSRSLRLAVTGGGDGTGSDHADWADLRLTP